MEKALDLIMEYIKWGLLNSLLKINQKNTMITYLVQFTARLKSNKKNLKNFSEY